MTEYKATPEQWQDGKHCADAGAIAFACILELRARVEALEAKSETQCLAVLDWAKDVEAMKCWNEQQVRRIMALKTAQPSPKPSSSKKQALASFQKIKTLSQFYIPDAVNSLQPHIDTVFQALEQLND
jgi:hypothetical protein